MKTDKETTYSTDKKGRMNMGKSTLQIWGLVFFWVAVVLMILGKSEHVWAEVKPEYMQDVVLDAAHFPDERFRKQLAHCVDTDKDGILTREEREKIYHVEIGFFCSLNKYWYLDMKDQGVPENHVAYKDKYTLELCYDFREDTGNVAVPEKILDVTGIEYFFNIEEVRVTKFEMLSGSFQNNAKLRKIYVKCTDPEFSKLGQKSYDNIREVFFVPQLTYIHLENIFAYKLNMEEIPNLQVLRVILPDGSNRRLSSVSLSKNKKLKELELGHILPGRLDLRRNQKLKTLKLYSGEVKAGQRYGSPVYLESDDYEDDGYYPSYSCYYYYLPEKGQNCKVIFPKRNQIQTFHYFTKDKKIDISMLTKLEDFQTLKTTKAKVRSGWIRRTFTKKKWGCAVVKNGKFVKKMKAAKRKKVTVI